MRVIGRGMPQTASDVGTAELVDDAIEQRMLPTRWRLVSLGQVCSLRGETVQPPFMPADIYVGLEHIDSGSPILSRWGSADEVTSAKSRFYPGDVLYGKLRPYLEKSVLPDFSGICSTDILVLQPGPDVDSAYLALLTHTRQFVGEAIRSTGGVNLPRTSWSALSQVEVALPPLPEQRAIAHILRTVQEAIQVRRREADLEQQRKAALMQHLFTKGTRGEATKQTEIGELPESCQITRLGDVVRDTIRDGTHRTPKYVSDGIPFITAKDIIDGHIEYGNAASISPAEHLALSKRVRPEPGDLLLTKVGTVGNVALVDTEQEFSIFVQVALIKPKLETVDALYLRYALESEAGQREIANKSSQSTMRFIGTQSISTVRIPLPPLPEQLLVGQTLWACDAKVAALKEERAQLEELFHALLEELMTGRLSALPLVEAAGEKEEVGA